MSLSVQRPSDGRSQSLVTSSPPDGTVPGCRRRRKETHSLSLSLPRPSDGRSQSLVTSSPTDGTVRGCRRRREETLYLSLSLRRPSDGRSQSLVTSSPPDGNAMSLNFAAAADSKSALQLLVGQSCRSALISPPTSGALSALGGRRSRNVATLVPEEDWA